MHCDILSKRNTILSNHVPKVITNKVFQKYIDAFEYVSRQILTVPI